MRRRRLALPFSGALVAIALLWPREAYVSGGAMVPVTLDKALESSELVIEGTSLGLRQGKVHINAAAAPQGALGPGDAGLDFEVEEVGVRVSTVLRGPKDGPKKGDELWFVDPTAYAYRSIGRIAQVAWIAVPQYEHQTRGRPAAGKPGGKLVVFGESAAHRRARKLGTTGLDDRLWLVAGQAYDEPAVAAQVRKASSR